MRIKRWLGEEEKRGRGEKDIEMTECVHAPTNLIHSSTMSTKSSATHEPSEFFRFR